MNHILFSKRIRSIIGILIFTAVSCLQADYAVTSKGAWPADWPKALEPLRKDAQTYEGPMLPSLHHAISFDDREKFESVWPVILKLKSKGAPIILKRGPSFWFDKTHMLGVCIHTPPEKQLPIDGDKAANRLDRTNYIELIVDGEIIDLNRILIPSDTPIIDQRFTITNIKTRSTTSQVQQTDTDIPAAVLEEE